MKKARWAFLAVLIGLLIGGLVFCSVGPKEPRYRGQNLSYWLQEWGNSYYDRTNSAADSIRAIGSGGVPILVAWLSKEESPGVRKFWRFAGNFVPDEMNTLQQDLTRALAAAEAINLLGLEAKAAFPTLTNLLSSRAHCVTASIALAGMGHEGIGVLLSALTNQDWIIRESAAVGLEDAGSDLDKVVPALIEAAKMGGTKKEDRLLRGSAASALVHLHRYPELIVPVFSEFLTNRDANTRIWAASVLGGFGADAKAAVPLLLEARRDTDPEVREATERALKEINPEGGVK
jgi:hypothetical protein